MAGEAETGQSDIGYCRALAERQAYWFYLSSLYAPAARRPDLWVLYALHAELAAIPAKAAEPLIREMRYTWWTDSVAAPDERAHPVLRALAQRPALYGHAARLVQAHSDAADSSGEPWQSLFRCASDLLAPGEGDSVAVRAVAELWAWAMDDDDRKRPRGLQTLRSEAPAALRPLLGLGRVVKRIGRGVRSNKPRPGAQLALGWAVLTGRI